MTKEANDRNRDTIAIMRDILFPFSIFLKSFVYIRPIVPELIYFKITYRLLPNSLFSYKFNHGG